MSNQPNRRSRAHSRWQGTFLFARVREYGGREYGSTDTGVRGGAYLHPRQVCSPHHSRNTSLYPLQTCHRMDSQPCTTSHRRPDHNLCSHTAPSLDRHRPMKSIHPNRRTSLRVVRIAGYESAAEGGRGSLGGKAGGNRGGRKRAHHRQVCSRRNMCTNRPLPLSWCNQGWQLCTTNQFRRHHS